VEITERIVEDGVELRVSGRLDASWADHLSRALDGAVRGGADRIVVEMSQISYVSSAGIRVLLQAHRQVRKIGGALAVANPSESVREVLTLTGLEALLASAEASRESAAQPAAGREFERDGIAFEAYGEASTKARCRAIGSPATLENGAFVAADCRQIRFPRGSFGLGLGAFGRDFGDCRGRFGEFVAAAGAAVYLPTDGANVPDSIVSSGALVPDVQVLYGLAWEGACGLQLRFEPSAGEDGVALSSLVHAALDESRTGALGMVIVAESAGLVGAQLRRSPALRTEPLFRFPDVRDWLSFTAERAAIGSLAVVVGVAAREAPAGVAPFLRRLGREAGDVGHFHAATLSYRPIGKGRLDVDETVSAIFENERLETLLHLLPDDRSIDGVGESELVRGTCWVVPLEWDAS
jgi:anti-anti-sigma factor